MIANVLRSFFVIIAAVAIVGGGTYSYFSATDTVSANTISAGTLEVAIENQNSTGALDFDVTGLAPGGTALVNFDVQNGGSINQAVHLRGFAQGAWQSVDTPDNSLIQVVKVEYWDGSVWATLAGNGIDPLTGLFYYSSDGTSTGTLIEIPAGGQAQLQLTVKLDEAAGDKYQGEVYDASLTVQTKQAVAPSWPADMSGF
jgi:predicted ribosomally synthesized peptide with SipW-like signal peptide